MCSTFLRKSKSGRSVRFFIGAGAMIFSFPPIQMSGRKVVADHFRFHIIIVCTQRAYAWSVVFCGQHMVRWTIKKGLDCSHSWNNSTLAVCEKKTVDPVSNTGLGQHTKNFQGRARLPHFLSRSRTLAPHKFHPRNIAGREGSQNWI